ELVSGDEIARQQANRQIAARAGLARASLSWPDEAAKDLGFVAHRADLRGKITNRSSFSLMVHDRYPLQSTRTALQQTGRSQKAVLTRVRRIFRPTRAASDAATHGRASVAYKSRPNSDRAQPRPRRPVCPRGHSVARLSGRPVGDVGARLAASVRSRHPSRS